MNLLQILIDQREEIINTDTRLLCSRKEESKIELKSKLAQVVIGVRRSGKSTLCQKVLLESGVDFAYVNFDDERLADLHADGLDEMLQCLYRINGDFTHLFLDEIQNIDKWPLFVNRLLRQGIKIILTGSNARNYYRDVENKLEEPAYRGKIHFPGWWHIAPFLYLSAA